MTSTESLLTKAMTLRNILVARATGSGADDKGYASLRRDVVTEVSLARFVPQCVQSCRDLAQFWGYIKQKFGTYHERRAYIWEQFGPLLDHLEMSDRSPADSSITDLLTKADPEHVGEFWRKALERRTEDPDGAITTARTLLEAVCKHILDESGASTEYDHKTDLPALYSCAAKKLNLGPSQHTEQIFKKILGGCQSVVEGLGSLRNKLSDAHGRGQDTKAFKPSARHAALAVNLAGSMALFLVETWEAKKS